MIIPIKIPANQLVDVFVDIKKETRSHISAINGLE